MHIHKLWPSLLHRVWRGSLYDLASALIEADFLFSTSWATKEDENETIEKPTFTSFFLRKNGGW